MFLDIEGYGIYNLVGSVVFFINDVSFCPIKNNSTAIFKLCTLNGDTLIVTYNQVRIQFNLSHKAVQSKELVFWTCVLDTDVQNVDYEFLTKNSKAINLGVDGFKISAKFLNFYENVDCWYKKRNSVFLPIDKNSGKCSPYIFSCTELTNYYDYDFSTKYIQFLANIELEIKKDFSEYEKIEIQKKSISAIKDMIGIDILNQESIPGSIAIYNRLSKFKLDVNYNAEKGDRYVKVFFEPEQDSCYLLEVEILENKKILYKQIYILAPNEKIILPDSTKLESFGQIHLSIFRQRKFDDSKIETNIVYEESGHLIRSFSIGVNTGGGNYKVIQNRFTGKKIEKVGLTQHSLTNSNKTELEPYQIEREYHYDLFGKDKKYLESQFFSENNEGRKKFLDWARNVLRRAKEVTIIDPFFDLNGFNDFNSCATTYFSLIVLTTDPVKCPRDCQNETRDVSQDLAKLITQSFQNAKVYYVDRAKLHDRYLIVFDGEETSYYNLSNSWNGTVNNYSLFVQELEFSIALQVKNCYSKYIDKHYLEKIDVSEVLENEKKEKNIVSDKETLEKYVFMNNVNDSIKNENFESIFLDLFNAVYYGCKSIDKFELLPLCISKAKYINNIELFVHDLVSRVLIQQKNIFLLEQKMFSTEKSLGWCTDIFTCMPLASYRHFCSGIPYYDLRIEYAQYKLLEACFASFPALVIKELCEQEKSVCVFNKDTKSEIKYYVSEQIVSYMLSENFRYFPEQKCNELVDFANRSKNFYCKIYIAQWILDIDDKEQKFEDGLNSLLSLKLDSKDITVFLGSFCSKLLRVKSETMRSKKNCIVDFISKNYAQSKECLILFALHAYLFSYEIYFEEFKAFIDNNQNVADELNKIFLLCSIHLVPDKKLFLLLEKHIDKGLLSYLPETKEKPRITDVAKYINYIPYIGQILCGIVKNNQEVQKGLLRRFELHPNFIFEINEHPTDEFDCYILLILLSALYVMKQQGVDVTTEIDSIKWYIPYLLNMHDDDFYGLSFKLLDVYANFISDSEKVNLRDKLISEKQKIFLTTTLQNITNKTLEQIQDLLDDYSFCQYDKTNSIIYLLALFINLVIYSRLSSSDKESMLLLFSNIKEKFNENIKSEKIQKCIEKGIIFYSENTEESKRLFIKELKTLYCPYTAYKFVDECNE